MEDETPDIESLIAENASSKQPKDPKRSARAKYNRRKISASHALDELEIAIDDLFAQNGIVYKRDEAERIKMAIEKFRDETGIVTPEPKPLTQEQMDHISEALENAKEYHPPTPEEQAILDRYLEELRASGFLPPIED